jgi:hypothetical protein
MAEEKSPTEREYEHLKSFFNTLLTLTLTAITLVAATGSLLFYKSVSEMKADEKAAVEDLRSSAQTDIARAKGEVLDTVRDEAKRRVEEEFSSRDITDLVEAAAKRKVGRTIDRQIQEEVGQTVSRLQDQIVETTKIADLGMRMRVTGSRDAFVELTKKYRETDDPDVRRTEKIILESVTADFEKTHIDANRQDNLTAQQILSMELRGSSNLVSTTAGFVNVIRTNQDLNVVCNAFLALRESTGVHFQMFDMDAVEKWCGENSAKCKQ